MISEFWTGGALTVDRRTIKFSKKINPFNILHMSDMHFHVNDTNNFNEFKVIYESIKDEIDLITWGGDLLSGDEGFVFLEKCKSLFGDIPVICIFGNHDVYKEPSNYRTIKTKKSLLFKLLRLDFVYETNALRKKLKNIGVQLLEDQSMDIDIKGNSLFIHGVKQPDYSVPHTKPEGLSFDEERLNIVMVHRPDMREKMVAGFDLLLGGHTHGGQIALPFFGPQLSACGVKPSTVSGHYRVGNTQWLVNNGYSSTRRTRMRYGCSREISLLRIEEGIPGDLKEVEFFDY